MMRHKVATRMRTTRSAVSRSETGRHARPALDSIEKHALFVGVRIEIQVRWT